MIVESNQPIPDDYNPNDDWRVKYPFVSMEVGQSVFFETDDKKDIKRKRDVAIMCGKRHGKKFTARKQPGGLRIWRTA